jgi:hypothetical protein
MTSLIRIYPANKRQLHNAATVLNRQQHTRRYHEADAIAETIEQNHLKNRRIEYLEATIVSKNNEIKQLMKRLLQANRATFA